MPVILTDEQSEIVLRGSAEAGLNEIQAATQKYADARETLSDLVRLVNDEVAKIYAAHVKAIRKLVGTVKEREATLEALLQSCPGLFASPRPRTVVFYGIKVGWRKGTGSLDWADDEALVKLIKKHFPEQEEVLIKKTEKPLVKPLGNLEVSDLKKLGITVEDTGDVTVIKPTDSAVDKVVKALLARSPEEEEGV